MSRPHCARWARNWLRPTDLSVLVLGIETSCDETAAAVVADGHRVLSSEVYSQIARHEAYGGVVPEIASRLHVEKLPLVVERARQRAGVEWRQLDEIAVTRGPGLAPALLVGVAAARALGISLGRPVRGVSHLAGHVYSLFLGEGAPAPDAVVPALILLVSGGHTLLLRLEEEGKTTLLGETVDDAAGEALDKGSILLGLGYPGGPAIEKAAEGGNPDAVSLPRPRVGSAALLPEGLEPSLCFSFSGLKTALRYFVNRQPEFRRPDRIADLAASFQAAVVDSLIGPVRLALNREDYKLLGCVGGVARNRLLRQRLEQLAREYGVELRITPPEYCTDNAAMIAAVAGSQWDRHAPLLGKTDPILPSWRLAGPGSGRDT